MKYSLSVLIISITFASGAWANSKSSPKNTVMPPAWILTEGVPSTGEANVYVMQPIITKNKKLALYPPEDETKREQFDKMVSLIDAGTEFATTSLGNNLAKIIAQMPKECQDKLVIESFSAPVKSLGHHVAGTVHDRRRVRKITVKGCLKVTPPACEAFPGNFTGGIANFGHDSMLRFFADCKDAMNDIATTQKRLDIWAERAAVELPVPKHRD